MTSVYRNIRCSDYRCTDSILCAVFISKTHPENRKTVSSAGFIVRYTVCCLWTSWYDYLVPFSQKSVNIPTEQLCFSGNSCACRYDSAFCYFCIGNSQYVRAKEYEEALWHLAQLRQKRFSRLRFLRLKAELFTAVVLGIGRAIGEAMAVMMVAGNVANMPSLFKAYAFLQRRGKRNVIIRLAKQALFSIS